MAGNKRASVKSGKKAGKAAKAAAADVPAAKPERIPNPNSKVLANKFVQEYLTTAFGENSVRIIKAANSEMTDEALAAKCKLKVSEIRSLLNKLHNLRLAGYTRIKDKDTGWYSYIWRINLMSIYGVLDKAMQDEMMGLQARLDESTTVFSFYCPKCSKENKIDFDTATQIGFTCPNCRKRLKADKGDTQMMMEKLEELGQRYADFKANVPSQPPSQLPYV